MPPPQARIIPGCCKSFCCGYANELHWCDEEATAILKEAESIVDLDRRKELYWEFQDIYAAQMPAFHIYWRVLLDAANQRVHGPAPAAVRGGPYWNIAEWWVD